jgi:tetrahydromethanopterin S-methyltransferase subunit E
MLSYISFKTLSGTPDIAQNFYFLISEANVITQDMGTLWGNLFLGVGIAALISVQLGIYDMMGRISGLAIRAMHPSRAVDHNRVYVIAVLVQMLFGIVVFLAGLQEPFWLIVVGAVFNAFAMGIISLVMAMLNSSKLPERYRPGIIVSALLFLAFLFYLSLFAYQLF